LILVIRDSKIVGFHRYLYEEDTSLSSGPSFKPISSISPGGIQAIQAAQEGSESKGAKGEATKQPLLPVQPPKPTAPTKITASTPAQIGAAILAARTTAGPSQTELAAKLKTARQNVQRLEKGRSTSSTNSLLHIANATGHKPVITFSPVP
jgi:hypothetical protein